MPSSYQNLKSKIRYLEQRGHELEQILKDIDGALGKKNVSVVLPFRAEGISGDAYLTDINMMGMTELGLKNICGNFS